LFWWESGGKIQEGVKFMSAKKEKSQTAKPAGNKNKNINPPNEIISDKGEFINILFKDLSGFIEIREIAAGKSNQIFFDSAAELINYDPPVDNNIYIGMFTRKQKRGRNKDIQETQVLWLDFDDVESFIEIEYILDTKGLPQPSIIVNSGHGYHCYWLLNKTAGAEIQPALKELAARTGADSHATDLARIMRLRDTMNVKDDPVKCKVEKLTNKTYKLKTIADLLGVEPKKPTQNSHSKPKQAAEALGIDYAGIKSKVDKPCIKSILEGVEVGQRNWLLGRLTRHLKDNLGFSKIKAEKVLKVWNLYCDPPQPKGELLASFNSYWHNDKLNLQGCRILDSSGDVTTDKQQILNKYCNKKECILSKQFQFAEVDGENLFKLNNRLLNNIKKVSAYSLIIYGVLGMHEEGLTTKRATKIIGITKKTFKKHIEQLIKLGFVRVREGIRQRGTSNLYYLTRQGTFKLGRSSISYAAIRILNAELKQGYLRPSDVKTYLLLRYFEYKSKSGEVYTATTTLAEKLGSGRSRTSKCINKLEERDFIEIDREKRPTNTYYFLVR
jgi:DNA-binding MarR family transcriptional regulator